MGGRGGVGLVLAGLVVGCSATGHTPALGALTPSEAADVAPLILTADDLGPGFAPFASAQPQRGHLGGPGVVAEGRQELVRVPQSVTVTDDVASYPDRSAASSRFAAVAHGPGSTPAIAPPPGMQVWQSTGSDRTVTVAILHGRHVALLTVTGANAPLLARALRASCRRLASRPD